MIKYLSQLEMKALHPDDFLPGFYGMRLLGVGEQIQCRRCGKDCAYGLVYDCGHYACSECDRNCCPQCGLKPRLRLVTTDGPDPFDHAVYVDGGCGKSFTLRTIEAHCDECPSCWLMSRYTPKQVQNLSPEELRGLTRQFSLSQLLDARDQAEKTLRPEQMLYLANVAEDTGENTEFAQPGIWCSNSEITKVEDVPAMVIGNDTSEDSSTARTRENERENALHKEQLYQELKARNEKLEAVVEQQR